MSTVLSGISQRFNTVREGFSSCANRVIKTDLDLSLVQKITRVTYRTLDLIKVFLTSIPDAFTGALTSVKTAVDVIEGTRFFGNVYALMKPDFKQKSVWKRAEMVTGTVGSFFKTLVLGNTLKIYELDKVSGLTGKVQHFKTLAEAGSLIASVLKVGDVVTQIKENSGKCEKIEVKIKQMKLIENPTDEDKKKLEKEELKLRKLTTERNWAIPDMMATIAKIVVVSLVIFSTAASWLSTQFLIGLNVLSIFIDGYGLVKTIAVGK